MKKFFWSLLANAVNSGYDRGERYLSYLSPVFFGMLTCWQLQFSKIIVFLFFSINKLLFLDKIGLARKYQVHKTVTKAASFSGVCKTQTRYLRMADADGEMRIANCG